MFHMSAYSVIPVAFVQQHTVMSNLKGANGSSFDESLS